MPMDRMVVGIKPVNFFTGNPGLDVPPSTQERNRISFANILNLPDLWTISYPLGNLTTDNKHPMMTSENVRKRKGGRQPIGFRSTRNISVVK
jgi:hypothetical protein